MTGHGGSLMRAAASLAMVLTWAPAARGQTDEIQVYSAEITAPGRFNLTWHNNFTFSGRTQAAFPGGIVPRHALNGVPEWSYGVTHWFEAGLYLPLYTLTSDGRLLLDSVKLRALFVVPDAHDRTVFYGMNFELSCNAAHCETRRFSGEIRPIIGAHLGRFDLIFQSDSGYRIQRRRQARLRTRGARSLPGHRQARRRARELRRLRSSPTLQTQLAAGAVAFRRVGLRSSSNGIELGIGRGLTRATDSWVVKLMQVRDL